MAEKQRQKDKVPPIYCQEGSGIYSEVSLTHHMISRRALPLVLKAIDSIPVKNGSVFTIVDYGTADGGTSMPLIYACVKALREKYGEELSINVIYEDQPDNDFRSLFKRVHGLIPGPPTFLQDFPNVFVMACGTSFYNQCLPKDSVTLALSTTAMHWLRDTPCNMTDALLPAWITLPEEKEKYRDQAEKDWELILLNRAEEMIQGIPLLALCRQKQYRSQSLCYSWSAPRNERLWFNRFLARINKIKTGSLCLGDPGRDRLSALVQIVQKAVPLPYETIKRGLCLVMLLVLLFHKKMERPFGRCERVLTDDAMAETNWIPEDGDGNLFLGHGNLDFEVNQFQGGRMVLVLPCLQGDDRKYHKTHSEWIYLAFLSILNELVNEGIVAKEEVNCTNFRRKRRTVEELKKPFQSEDSPVRQAGLELIAIDTHVTPCQHYQKWMKENGDVRQHAKEFVTSIRTWSNGTFMAGLSVDSRSPEEKAQIVEEFYRRHYEDEVAKHPEDHGLLSAHAYLYIQKRL